MATIRAFKAVRPTKEYADCVLAAPYDVMNRKEATEMAAGNPASFLHVTRAEIDLPELENPYAPQVYQKGKKNLEDFIEKGILFRESRPMLYIYRLEMDGRQQTGIVGCVPIDAYLDGTVKKHELTRVDKEIDRINHFDVCDAHTEPVFLTYRDDMRIRAMVEGAAAHENPEYDILTPEGVRHRLWRMVDRDLVAAIIRLFEDVPSLYIADGHHRSASACKVGIKRREENPDFNGEEAYNFFLAVLFPDRDLRVFDYNRTVKDLNGNTKESFIAKLKAAGFEVEEKGSDIYRPEKRHTFGMFLEGVWYRLTAKPALIPEDAIGRLDVSILQEHVLAPILGIADPRTDKRIDFIGGIRGLAELERRTRTDMKVAFAVYPAAIEDLIDVSDQGLVMPPKSTWFEPKLGSGLFLHELSEGGKKQ